MSRFLQIGSCCGAVVVLTLFSPAAIADVNLEWRPGSVIVDVGEQVRFGLYAVSTTGGDQPILALEVIFEWDPMSVEFLGLVNNGAAWQSSDLPDDSVLDGLNDSLTDGDAYYRALAQFGNPVVATPDGLLVASFDFRALVPANTSIAIVPSAGNHTETTVWDGQSAGNDIVGTLGTAHLTIRCVNDGECSDGNECTQDSCGAGVCANPPEPAGAPCGNLTDTVCDNADSCDGNGTCLDNFEPRRTPCPDVLFCNGEEACDDAGICQTGAEPCTDPLLPFCDENNNGCVECLTIGDANGDGNVDLQDLAVLAGALGCLTEPGGPANPPLYAPECRCLDADDDGDIDMVDFAYFQRNFSG